MYRSKQKIKLIINYLTCLINRCLGCGLGGLDVVWGGFGGGLGANMAGRF